MKGLVGGTPSTPLPTSSTASTSPSSLSSTQRGQNTLYPKHKHPQTAGKGDGDAPKMAGQPRLRGGRAGGESRRGTTRECRCLCPLCRWVWDAGQQFQSGRDSGTTVWAGRGGRGWGSQGQCAEHGRSLRKFRSLSAAGAGSVPPVPGVCAERGMEVG